MLKLLLSSLFLFVNFQSSFSTIYPDSVLVVENEGFLVYVVSEAGKFSECSVTVEDKTYNLAQNQEYLIDGHTQLTRFSSSPDSCGMRVKNVKKSIEGKWEIKSNVGGHQVIDSLTVNVNPASVTANVFNQTVLRDSSSEYITCPNSAGARYCSIEDSEGNVANCPGLFKLNRVSNVFTCKLLYYGDMNEIHTRINVIFVDKPTEAVGSVIETDTHIVATCKYYKSVEKCRAVSVDSNREFLLSRGILTDRYSAYDTNAPKGICSIEIEKPLRDVDKGVWRIYQSPNLHQYTGCVFRLGDTPKAVNASSAFTTERRKKIELISNPKIRATTTRISCEVPYKIDYCYLQGPTSNTYKPLQFDTTKYLGICEFDVANITTGTYACGVNGENGGEDQLTYYDVNVYDRSAEVVTGSLHVGTWDKNQKMLCKTVLNAPLQGCRFTTPAGEVHSVSEHNHQSFSRFKYYGSGLVEGECGIEIKNIVPGDFGEWKCTMIFSYAEEHIMNIAVIEKPLGAGAIAGITIAVIAVSVAAVGFFGYRRYSGRVRYPRSPSIVPEIGMSRSATD